MVRLEHERCRTYFFPKNEEVSIFDVTELLVSKSGGHRLTTKDGRMMYIPFTWLAIKIDSSVGWEA